MPPRPRSPTPPPYRASAGPMPSADRPRAPPPPSLQPPPRGLAPSPRRASTVLGRSHPRQLAPLSRSHHPRQLARTVSYYASPSPPSTRRPPFPWQPRRPLPVPRRTHGLRMLPPRPPQRRRPLPPPAAVWPPPPSWPSAATEDPRPPRLSLHWQPRVHPLIPPWLLPLSALPRASPSLSPLPP